VVEYLAVVRAHAASGSSTGPIHSYPGSGRIAQLLLRSQDRAVLCELAPGEAAPLRRAIGRDERFHIICGDGYAAIRAYLPPRERRGLVLIDPPYELQHGEVARVEEAALESHRRWPTGIIAIWYPIKRRAVAAAFHERIERSGMRKILCAELCLYPDDSRVSLNGCGMLIVNPPFGLESALNEALPAIHSALGARAGTRAGCFWLIPE
jgi:23S rRNA (adenine2030-N6)-methyltransferase